MSALLDQVRARINADRTKELAIVEAGAAGITTLERLAAYLSARGWKPTPHVGVHPIGGLTLSLHLYVPRRQRVGALLDELAAQDMLVFRAGETESGEHDISEYTIHLAGNLRIGLVVAYRSRRAQAAA